jgi:hypothetical protein
MSTDAVRFSKEVKAAWIFSRLSTTDKSVLVLSMVRPVKQWLMGLASAVKSLYLLAVQLVFFLKTGSFCNSRLFKSNKISLSRKSYPLWLMVMRLEFRATLRIVAEKFIFFEIIRTTKEFRRFWLKIFSLPPWDISSPPMRNSPSKKTHL